MTDHGKSPDPAQQDEYARELTELLNLLETVDRQITPGHIAQRFCDLLDDIGDSGHPSAPPAPAGRMAAMGDSKHFDDPALIVTPAEGQALVETVKQSKLDTRRTSARARERGMVRHPPSRRGERTRGRRGHSAVRHQPAPRRARYGRFQAPQMSIVSVAAGVLAVALVAGGLLLGKLHFHPAIRPGGISVAVPAAQFVYTERTANDAAITLPAAVQSELYQIAVDHQSIAVTRVGFTGHISTSDIDMAPRTGNRPRMVGIGPTINTKITTIEKAVNSSPASATGGHALLVGLTKIDFTGAPVTIISSGLDLADPDNFRALQWSAPPGELVAVAKKAGALPSLHGPVTFVLVPTAGAQPQLGQAQKTYLKAVWTDLLTASGATSVRFIDATATRASSAAPSAPTVPVPAALVTPVVPVHLAMDKVTCTLPASYFMANTAKLVNPARTQRDLTPCIQAALAAHATFALDGWTSYKGPLNTKGKPAIDEPYNRKLSEKQVRTIANLLVNDLGVPRSEITRMTGHGNMDQPYPGPNSPANQVVIITYTIK